MSPRILVVEDHPLFAEALMSMLGGAIANVSLTLAHTLAQAKALAGEKGGFDLVTLDLWLPDCLGFEGVIALKMMRPALPVVVISAFTDSDVIHNAIACGASGFIPKSSSRQDMINNIREALDGHVPLPHAYRPPLPPEPQQDGVATLKTKLSTLTHQQLRVLQMLCQGMLNKQIAHALGVGETTVKAHVSEILRKLGVSTRTQAVLGISRVGLGSEPKLPVKGASASERLPFYGHEETPGEPVP